MYSKIFLVVSAVIVVCVSRERHHRATSYISVNNRVSPEHDRQEFDFRDEGNDDSSYDDGGHEGGNDVYDGRGYFGGYEHHDELANHHPKYDYKYGVDDKHTKDFKTHQEHRVGDTVKGEYTVLQPDGKTRIVRYTADEHNGFHAEVFYGDTHSDYDFHGYN